MRLVALVMVVVGGGSLGCGRVHDPDPIEPPLRGRAEPLPKQSTPPPVVSWTSGAFETPTLPAVARGGELAVIPVHDSDGDRGYPNLRLEIRDRQDHTIRTLAVMTADELEVLSHDDMPTVTLERRIEGVNRELAQLHAVHELIPMHELEVREPPEGDKHFAAGDGFDIDWSRDHLHVFHHSANRSFVTRDGRGWLAPTRKSCGGCDPCENPAFLSAVYHATAINMLVVAIGYKGTDLCWEPADQLHVIAW
jgi:hypothetical protein